MFKILALFAFIGIASALSPGLLRGQVPHHRASPVRQAAPTYQRNAATSSHHSSSDDVHAEVKSAQTDVRADGYDFAFDTTNDIHVASYGDEQGNMHGDFSYISPEGVRVALTYVADENGYQPSGDLLPTPPPIPEAILRSLEYIRTHAPQQDDQPRVSNVKYNNNNRNYNNRRNY